MIAVQSQTETRRGGPVPGLDQPCSRNPTAALPLVGRDPYVPCTPCGERGATGWGGQQNGGKIWALHITETLCDK